MNTRRKISIIQIIAALVLFPMWFALAPQISTKPISELSLEMREEYPPPEQAVCFTVGHGVPTYFNKSISDAPIHLIIQIMLFGACLFTLIIPALYYSPDNKKYGNWFSRIRIKREQNTKQNQAVDFTKKG